MTVIVSDHLVGVNGRRLHYRDWGPRDAHPMLLVHGYPGHSHIWDKFAAAMGSTHRLIAVDLCGLGESDWADDYSFASWADDLHCLASALGLPPVTMIGYSLGSTIGFCLAESHPTMLEHLVAVDGLPLGSWEPTTPNAGALPPAFSNINEYLTFRGQNPTDTPEEELYDAVRFDLKVNQDGSLGWRHDLSVRDAILRELRFDNRWKVCAARNTVRITYLRCGRTHVGSYETTSAILRHFPGCELIDIPDVGHNLPTKHPDTLIAIVSNLT